MIKWILQDVKRTLKSRKTYLIIVVIILSMGYSLFSMFNLKNSSPLDEYGNFIPAKYAEIWGFNTNDVASDLTSSFDYICVYEAQKQADLDEGYTYEDLDGDDEKPEKDCSNYQNYLKILGANQKVEDSYNDEVSDEDIAIYYQSTLAMLDFATDDFITYYDQSNDAMQERLREKAIDIELIKSLKKEIKETMSKDYEPFHLEAVTPSVSTFNELSVNMIETYTSYQSNYPIEIKSLVTPSFFIANYMNDYFLLLVAVSALLIFDSFYKDYSTGVIKTILSSPTRRFRYAVMKTISSTLSIFAVILAPMMIAALGLFVYNGLDASNYPVYISNKALNSFEPTKAYTRILSEFKPADNFSTYQNICSVAPVSKFPADITAAGFGAQIDCISQFSFSTIDIISLSKYLGYVFGYFVLVLIFIASINTLLSLVMKNQITNLIVLALIIGSTLLVNKVFIGSAILKVLPFTFLSPAALLMGTVPYTFLNGLVTLGLWTLAINIINYIVIKRIDFEY